MGFLKEIKVFPRDKIKTVAKVNDRADDSGIGVVALIRFPLRPLPRALRIGFPEVRPRAQPIEIAFALQKVNLAIDGLHRNAVLAPVVTEYE